MGNDGKNGLHLGYLISFTIIMFIVGALLFALADFLNLQIWALVVIVCVYLAILSLGYSLIRKKGKAIKALYYLSLATFVIPFAFGGPKQEAKKAYDWNTINYTEVVNVKHGQLRGLYSRDGKTEIYTGIPYAKAPVGDLRWKPTVEEEDWEGVKDCVYFAPRAMQEAENAFIETGKKIVIEEAYRPDFNYYPYQEMSEDCLYLNVWAPKTSGNTTYPVLVYIHGGSLTGGSAADDDINGEALSKLGIVCATVAYRLNVFGYFAHEDLIGETAEHTTGNYGLLDQIRALHWVQENISKFHGDPTQVTIAGESAGSSCISALCVTPLASGLFNRAIGESSSIAAKIPPHTFRSKETALKMGSSIMEEFGCNSIDELRKIPAEKLVNTKHSNDAMTIDGYALTKTPYELYKEGIHNESALLHGCNAQEADPFVMPEWLFSFQGPPNLSNYEQRIRDRFKDDADALLAVIGEVKTDEEAYRAYNDAISAYWFNYPDYSWGQQAMGNGVQTYRYLFNKENAYMGAWHSGEIIYAYGNVESRRKQFGYRYDDSDVALSKLMANCWANFIKTGNPNGDDLPTWSMDTPGNDQVMIFDTESKMGKDTLYKYYDFFAQFESKSVLK